MDRFTYGDSSLSSFSFGEFQICSQEGGVRLYDGSNKTGFENGEAVVTSHRLIWRGRSDRGEQVSLVMHLASVRGIEEESGSFTRSDKVVVHLGPRSDALSGPSPPSRGANLIKLSFKSGGESDFFVKMREAIQMGQWKIKVQASASRAHGSRPATAARKMRSGIGGIERQMEARAKQTDSQISKAFQDLDKLMEMAKPMVALAKNISGKIRDKHGEVSDDETVEFKSYLLSLGISDPVTRETHGSGQAYYRELSKEICRVLEKPVQDAGGMMTLTDAFCRLNRARGLELVSPEDLLNGCRELGRGGSGAPLKLHTFEDSGVTVLRLSSQDDASVLEKTSDALQSSGSLTAEEYSRSAGISVILAKERLLAAERSGAACRDDDVEGLRFFVNRFLLET